MTEETNIYTALAKAQASFLAPKKDAKNPHFKSMYADLASVVEAVRFPLGENGIAFFHVPHTVDGTHYMDTVLVHGESGSEVRCSVPLIVGKNDMQGYKSATTYAKRIGLESLTGVAPDDDDGNAAAANPPKNETRPRTYQEQSRSPENGAYEMAVETMVTQLIGEIEKAQNISELQTVWTRYAGQPAPQERKAAAKDPRCEQAKDKRKAELEGKTPFDQEAA